MSYKTCTLCNFEWQNVNEIIQDRTLSLNGYQASFPDPKDGFFLLTHKKPGCLTTIAVLAADFKPLYKGPIYTNHNTGSASCPGKCNCESNFETCTEKCDMAWAREIMQLMLTHKLPS
jgi:hypothetical protein